MGQNHSEHNFGQFLLGLHLDGIAGRTSGGSDRWPSRVWPQHVMGQRIDHVLASCVVHRLQSAGCCTSAAWTDVGYVCNMFTVHVHIDIECNCIFIVVPISRALFHFHASVFSFLFFRCIMASHTSNDSRMDSASRSFKIHGKHDGVVAGRCRNNANLWFSNWIRELAERVLCNRLAWAIEHSPSSTVAGPSLKWSTTATYILSYTCYCDTSHHLSLSMSIHESQSERACVLRELHVN